MSISVPSSDSDLEKIARYLIESERVLIGAGAGLSAAAGIDYTDSETFVRLFPVWAKRGYKMQYQFVGVDEWKEPEKWAYWATHVNYVFYEFPPSPLYQTLHQTVSDKDFYVITSNADGLFIKSGFEPERVFQAQGNYERLHCTNICSRETWETKPFIDKALRHIDHDSFRVADEDALPKCPKCGAPLFVAFRHREEYKQWAVNYENWIRGVMDKKLIVFEFGIGFNTPGVIRWPFERLVKTHSNVLFVRVNTSYKHYLKTGHPEIPSEIEHKSMSINQDAGEFIQQLDEKVNELK